MTIAQEYSRDQCIALAFSGVSSSNRNAAVASTSSCVYTCLAMADTSSHM